MAVFGGGTMLPNPSPAGKCKMDGTNSNNPNKNSTRELTWYPNQGRQPQKHMKHVKYTNLDKLDKQLKHHTQTQTPKNKAQQLQTSINKPHSEDHHHLGHPPPSNPLHSGSVIASYIHFRTNLSHCRNA